MFFRSLFPALPLVLIGLGLPVAAAPGPFSDVPLKHPAYATIYSLQRLGFRTGFPDGALSGRRPLTRYELALATVRIGEQYQRLTREPGESAVFAVNSPRRLPEVPPEQAEPLRTALSARESRRQVLKGLATLVAEFRTTLAQLGEDVPNAQRKIREWLATDITAAQRPERPPNIVLIFTDDQGYGDVGAYGAKDFDTPNLDHLAREGRKFTNFHVAQPVCSASRAALLTGCYPNRIGIHGALGPAAKHGLHAEETTLAEVLKGRGYATGMAGKWHLGHHPQFLPVHHGFDEYLGLPYSNDMWPRHPEARPGTYPPLPLIEGDRVLRSGLTGDDQAQLTRQYTQRAVRFIERNRERPFFFYLAHSMPHVPLFASEKFRGKSRQGAYGDVIQEIDWSVGEVLKALEKQGLERNTLVIFTTDNGPWLSYGDHAGTAGPLREGKGTCWEGGTRVPALMRWPGKLPAGTTSDAMLMTIDLLPTLARLAGAEPPQRKIDGLDVWPLLAGERGAKNPHDAYFYYYHVNQLQAVTTGDGRWKLMLPHQYTTLSGRPGGTGGTPVRYEQRRVAAPELYDLAADISESRNVAADHPDVVERLLALAEKAREDLGDALTGRPGSGRREAGRIPGGG